ncbi:radical SAM protein [Methylobacterium sp. 17Sr1-1]|uniref:radical SAM/SPASM domain-containing protein n=1 Tax=Methylobacterium sp. 17Sr1-1 TaxID=2202826 RepID=UPI000D6FC5BE|nr:radical SAM protein [Methylobacterium sp. 17Sr1-1]AWN55418.1 hypothetical protein DK412_04935 [Methylobacterium sp. 17Sr1-1]
MSTTHNVFVHERDGRHFLYAPLRDIVVELDTRTASAVREMLNGNAVTEFDGRKDWLEFLTELRSDDFQSPSHNRSLNADKDAVSHYAPTSVVLSLTKECNLRCVYCYIHGGEEAGSMEFDIARASIDFVASNARSRNFGNFGVSFHGEGEPTFKWSLFKNTVIYAQQVANELSIGLGLFLTSNGMWSTAQYDFITKHFDGISISLDGLESIQNSQRPTSSGEGSFGIVSKNLKRLKADGVQCAVRLTVMRSSIGGIIPFLEYIKSETLVKDVQLEPLFNSGRGVGLQAIDRNFELDFASELIKAQKFGKEIGLNLTYSGCVNPTSHKHFCGATGQEPNFVVMSDGTISSCYEVSKESHKLGEFFLYGTFNKETGRFELSNERLERLMHYKKSESSPCNSCFAQSNCVGDCLTRRELHQLISGEGSSSRCSLNREVLSRSLVHRLDGATEARS